MVRVVFVLSVLVVAAVAQYPTPGSFPPVSGSNPTDSTSSDAGADAGSNPPIISGDQKVPTDITSSESDFPCTKEGFFNHPEDCSKFYRCVNHAADGNHLSLYEFVCPAGQTFVAKGTNTCVPSQSCKGSGDSSSTGDSESGSGDSASPSESESGTGDSPSPSESGSGGADSASPSESVPDSGDSASPSESGAGDSAKPSESASSSGDTPSAGGDSSAQPGDGSEGNKPGADASSQPSQDTAGGSPAIVEEDDGSSVTGGGAYPSPDAGSSDGNAGEQACKKKYVQDAKFCNVYHDACPGENKQKWACNTGIFVEEDQMCTNLRNAYGPINLCGPDSGKTMHPVPAFRSSVPSFLVGEKPYYTHGSAVFAPSYEAQSPILNSHPISEIPASTNAQPQSLFTVQDSPAVMKPVVLYYY